MKAATAKMIAAKDNFSSFDKPISKKILAISE
jgi:hypothetical protein